jgi:hypothetical protein
MGNLLRWARDHRGLFRLLMFAVLAALLGLNLVLLPHHPHFPPETVVGFWAAFGLAGAVVMTLVLKKGLFPIISRPESFYGRDNVYDAPAKDHYTQEELHDPVDD